MRFYLNQRLGIMVSHPSISAMDMHIRPTALVVQAYSKKSYSQITDNNKMSAGPHSATRWGSQYFIRQGDSCCLLGCNQRKNMKTITNKLRNFGRVNVEIHRLILRNVYQITRVELCVSHEHSESRTSPHPCNNIDKIT